MAEHEPARRGTGNVKRTKHLDQPQEPAVRNSFGGSGNPPGLRRSRNAEDLLARRVRAVELRVLGYGYREIGSQLGISGYVAHQDVKHILQGREAEAVAHGRAVEEARLDKLVLVAMQIATGESNGLEIRLKAIDRVIRAIGQRAQLLGLNVPAQLNVNITEKTQADLELDELLREAEARNAATLQELTGGSQAQ